MATFNIQLPNVRQLDWNDRNTQRIILDYLNELTEKLNYTLNNLDMGNFDRQTYTDMTAYAQSAKNSERLIAELQEGTESAIENNFEELRSMILNSATSIEDKYDKKFEDDEESLSIVYNHVMNAIKKPDSDEEYGSLTEAWGASFTVSAEGIKAIATAARDLAVKTSNGLAEHNKEQTKILTFDAEKGLKISAGNAAGSYNFSTQISGSELAFYQGDDTKVAYISGSTGVMMIPIAYVADMTIGNVENVPWNFRMGSLEWVQETANDSISLRKRVQ